MGAETYCLICGGPLNSDGIVFTNIPLLEKILSKLSEKNQRIVSWSSDNMEAYLDALEETGQVSESDLNELQKNVIQIKNIPKYKWLKNLVILHKSGKIFDVTVSNSWDREFKDKKGNEYITSFLFDYKDDIKSWQTTRYKREQLGMYDPTSKNFFGDGYVVHKDCYKIAQQKYGKFNFNHIFLANIDFKEIRGYQGQEVPWIDFFINNVDYLLESPIKNTKNKNRILKLKHPIKKVKKSSRTNSKKKSSRANSKKKSSRSNRPSPSVSATSLRIGTKKKGNDGNTWIIVADKRGVQRWKKL